MKVHLQYIQQSFTKVFAHTSYIALASSLAIAAFLFVVWLPNFGLIGEVLSTSSAPLAAKLKVVISLLGGISTNFSTLSASYTIAIAILFGIVVTMVVYLVRKRIQLGGNTIVTGFSGTLSGILGIGCAACGSFLLMAILSSFGAAGALTLLPLKGGEFGVLSVILLAFSLVLISKKIVEPLICKT